MIEIINLKKSYSEVILDGLNFSVPPNTFLTIFGPNGCGKSTLINIIAGLDPKFDGEIRGVEKPIAYVFQDYRRSLLPWLSAKENILFPLKLRKVPRTKQEEKLNELIEITSVNLDLDKKVFDLSGGQAQTVCILRALIVKPKILILDEPFAALDYEKTIELRTLISKVAKKLELNVFFISHDLDEAILLGDKVLFLSKNPTKIVDYLDVDLPYPRDIKLLTATKFNILREKLLNNFKLSF